MTSDVVELDKVIRAVYIQPQPTQEDAFLFKCCVLLQHASKVKIFGLSKAFKVSAVHPQAAVASSDPSNSKPAAQRRTANNDRGRGLEIRGGRKAATLALEMEIGAHAAGGFNDGEV
ncbi:g11281 [Coccomyxa elongata]